VASDRHSIVAVVATHVKGRLYVLVHAMALQTAFQLSIAELKGPAQRAQRVQRDELDAGDRSRHHHQQQQQQ
jgi:hypothetical protein